MSRQFSDAVRYNGRVRVHVVNVPAYFLGAYIQDGGGSAAGGTKELLCEKFHAPRFFPDGRLKVPPESNLQIPPGVSPRPEERAGVLLRVRSRPAKLTNLRRVVRSELEFKSAETARV